MEPLWLGPGAFLLWLLVAFAPVFLGALIYSAVGQQHRVADDNWVDKFWGDGSIDDDEWGLSVFNARQTGDRKRAELAERNGHANGPHRT